MYSHSEHLFTHRCRWNEIVSNKKKWKSLNSWILRHQVREIKIGQKQKLNYYGTNVQPLTLSPIIILDLILSFKRLTQFIHDGELCNLGSHSSSLYMAHARFWIKYSAMGLFHRDFLAAMTHSMNAVISCIMCNTLVWLYAMQNVFIMPIADKKSVF